MGLKSPIFDFCPTKIKERLKRSARGAFICMVALFVFARAGRGELVWEKTSIELEATLNDKKATAVFPFTNEGDKPVKIVEIRTSCTCTTPKDARGEYPPGSGGTIEALFEFGSRAGLRRNNVWVKTDSKDTPEIKLEFSVVIPTPVALRPPFALWREGETPEEKNLAVSVAKGVRVELDALDLEVKEAFDVSLTEAGESYALRIKPKSTKTPCRCVISLKGTLPNGEQRTFKAYALIKKER